MTRFKAPSEIEGAFFCVWCRNGKTDFFDISDTQQMPSDQASRMASALGFFYSRGTESKLVVQ